MALSPSVRTEFSLWRSDTAKAASLRRPLLALFEFGVNHFIASSRAPRPRPAVAGLSPAGLRPGASRRSLAIGRRGQPVRELLQVACELAQPCGVGRVVLDQLANLRDQLLGPRLFVNRRAVTQILELSLDLVSDRVGVIARLDLFTPPPILVGVPLPANP